MKTVEYLGSTYEVPDWANFIAADSDGEVVAFEFEPLWWDSYYALSPSKRGRGLKVGSAEILPPPLKAI